MLEDTTPAASSLPPATSAPQPMKSLSLTTDPAVSGVSGVKKAREVVKAEPKFGLKDIEDESDHEHEQVEQTRKANLAKVSNPTQLKRLLSHLIARCEFTLLCFYQ